MTIDMTLQQAWAGDARAFERVYHRFNQIAAAGVQRVLRYDIDATVQEVWIKLLRRMRAGKPLPTTELHFRRLLRRVAFACACTEYRRRVLQNQARTRFLQAQKPRIGTLDSPMEHAEQLGELRRAMRGLTPRELVCLRFVTLRRMSTREAASRLDIQESRVRGYLTEARAKVLRQLMQGR